MIDEPDEEWLKNDRDYWMRRAKTAEGERDAWDENHQILSEHYQRMTERAERAEAEVEVKDQRIADVRDYWKNDRERLQAEKEKADATRETATRMMIEATSRAKRAENRAAAWWRAAKTLCRQRNVCNNAASEGWHRAFEYRERAEKTEADKPHVQAENR